MRSKKFAIICACFVFVLALSVVNASGSTTGAEDVASALETGLSSANIWGTLLALTGLIVIITLVALGRRTVNKNLTSVKRGSAGKV